MTVDEWADDAITRPAEPRDYEDISADEAEERADAICIAAAIYAKYENLPSYIVEYARIIRVLN